MELYLFEHESSYARLYNCSTYSVEEIPLAQRQHITLGVVFIVLFLLFQLLYIPCIVAIVKHLQYPSFKVMLYIGILDMLCLCVNGLATGIYAIEGAVFCSHPDQIYWLGVAGLFFWMAESSAEFVLALNRCVDTWYPNASRALFEGSRTWLWLLGITAYAFLDVYYDMPLIFSGVYFSWFFNPHVSYIDDPLGASYHNLVHSINNGMICFGLSGLYLSFAISLWIKRASIAATMGDSRGGHHGEGHSLPFIQVIWISAVNMVAASIYVYMQFFPTSPTLIIVAQFAWLFAHGSPPLIYLTMNQTIRRESSRFFRSVFGSSGHSSTHVGAVSGVVTIGQHHHQTSIPYHRNGGDTGNLAKPTMSNG